MRTAFFTGIFMATWLVNGLSSIETARAEQVPEQYLNTAYENCMVTARSGINDLAIPYCTCMKNRLRIVFTKEQFEQLDREAQSRATQKGGNYAGIAEQMPRLKAVATACLHRVRGDS